MELTELRTREGDPIRLEQCHLIDQRGPHGRPTYVLTAEWSDDSALRAFLTVALSRDRSVFVAETFDGEMYVLAGVRLLHRPPPSGPAEATIERIHPVDPETFDDSEIGGENSDPGLTIPYLKEPD